MNKEFKKLFVKFFMPYLLIIGIMSALSTIVYIIAFKEIENNAIKMQEAYIEQSKSILDQQFKEAIDASQQIRQIPMVGAFIDKTSGELNQNYFPTVQLLNQLKDVRLVNDGIEEYFIFYKNSEKVVTWKSVGDFYVGQESFQLIDRSKDDFLDKIFQKYYFSEVLPEENFYIYEESIKGILMLTTIGYDVNNPQAVIIMVLNADKIRGQMPDFEQNLNGNFFIINKDNSILISSNDEFGITNDGYIDQDTLKDNHMIFKKTSKETGYTYVLAQPTEAVFREINQLKNILNIIIGVIFMIGVIVSYISARYNSKPVHKLISKHDELLERVKNQIPYIRTTLLERWLKGNYTHIEEIVSITKYLRVKYIGNFYCVLVVDYDQRINVFEDLNESNINKLEIKRLIVKDLLTAELFQVEYVHDIDHDKLAIIFIGDGNDEASFRKSIEEQVDACIALLHDEGIEDLHFGIGNIYPRMEELTLSLSNAMDALATISTNEKENVVWFETLSQNNDSYYYPPEIETRLFNCIRVGDSEQVNNILRELLKQNILDKSLPPHMLKVFIYELWGTLAKVQDKAVGENNTVKETILTASEQLDTLSDLEKIQLFKKVLLEVCEINHIKKEDKHDQVKDNINQYIRENFSDPDFCLQMVSEQFKLSYAYLSQVFKEFNDMSFINYLQQLRMEEAERLLQETDMPVKDIVMACGYNSSNTFGRAFKRIHGVSAGAYRERNRNIS